ncbi:MAG: DUF4157 domain-containing protein, partial [Chloroflexi bacterium]|nr:DUF4157 domain-containing protein [Chloroflexota bacterium]
MSGEHTFEEKGKVKPKPSQETAAPQKENAPITKDKMEGKLDPSTVRHMQQTVGNTAVQRFLAQRSGSGPTELDEDTAANINQQRGSGQSLDEGMAAKAGGTMGQDFSDVNVHTDSSADQLSRQLGAKAFTTGNDIFFRDGAYNPASSDSQRLISHELTHVVQQGASTPAVQGKMSVNDPNDQYEAEADNVADKVMAQPDNLQMQEEEEMLQPKLDDGLAQRQEEEEMLQPKLDDSLAQRQEEEEEMLQPKLDDSLAQRQEEEEEMLQPKLDDSLAQRQEEEEEMLQPKL